MTRLFLIRHGITGWNAERRYCGHKDVSLAREGRLQVKKLRGRLDKVKFDKIYCSDRKRAIETACMLFKKKPIKIDSNLREVNFGVLEGLRHEEIMRRYADIYRRWLKGPFKNRIPGAEPMNIFKKRVDGAMKKIVRLNRGKTVAVVCHGGVIGVFINGISGKRNFWRSVPSAASVTVVACGRRKTRLQKFNDTTHLRVNNE